MTAQVRFPSTMLIGGELTTGRSTATLTAVDPTTELEVGRVPDATDADVDDAVASAAAASAAWAATPWQERAERLRDYAGRIRHHREELAALDVADAGLPVTSARADVSSAVAEIEYFAGLAGQATGSTYPGSPGTVTYTEFVPYSVVGRIVPFNHPLKFAAAKPAAALAAGCAVVVKPGEHTSASAMRLAELSRDAFPPGVFNLVTGRGVGAGAALAAHPRVPRIAFTGGPQTGRAVAAAGVAALKHVSLELGGKNPFVVFPDVDPQRAALGAIRSMNFARSMGQSCGSTSRVFVHESLHDEFVDHLVRGVAALRIGDPRDEGTQIGPLAFHAHHERVLAAIAAGLAEGATCAVGGQRPPGRTVGYFLQPTVFTDVAAGMTIEQEEIFGPVLAVLRWRDEDEMLEAANGTVFGLTANVWTSDLSRALGTARRLDAGYVSVNGSGARPLGAPFGGFKASGYGKESSLDELLSYGRHKSVTVTLG